MRTLLSLFSFIVTPSFVYAAPATYNLLSPLGPLSGAVSLSTYLQGIVLVIIGVAGILAVVMIVICAIQMIASPSVSQKSQSKECITNALVGLILAFSSWIILGTINTNLLKSDFALTGVGTPVAVTPSATPSGTYAWSTVAGKCPPVTGKIVSAVPISYCVGLPSVFGAPCCGYITSPLTPPVVIPPPPVVPPVVIPPPPATTVKFSVSTYSVNEGAGVIVVTVTRSAGTGSGTVDYASADSSATKGLDYTAVSGTLVFAPGVTTQTFTVPIIDDVLVESTERFLLSLSNGTGSIGLAVPYAVMVYITDNDVPPPPPPVDTIPPTVSIISPPKYTATTSSVVNVTFAANDNVGINSVTITYAPPGPAVGNVVVYCKLTCPTPLNTMVPVSIYNTIIGNHTIQVSVCDLSKCVNTNVIITIQGPCVPNSNINCLTLPIGKNPLFPLCETSLPTTPGKSGIPIGTKTNAYEFKVTANTGGGTVYFMGGFENEYPPPAQYSLAMCIPNLCVSDPTHPSCMCIYGTWTGFGSDCTTYQPPNLVVSISDYEGDLSSTPTTVPTIGKSVSGNCGSAGTGAKSKWVAKISTVAGPGVCKVELNRKYYVNVSTYPFIPVNGKNPIEYSMYWDYSPI